MVGRSRLVIQTSIITLVMISVIACSGAGTDASNVSGTAVTGTNNAAATAGIVAQTAMTGAGTLAKTAGIVAQTAVTGAGTLAKTAVTGVDNALATSTPTRVP